MAYIDYYKILGLSKSATQNQIKKAYRKLARKYHPDVNPNDKDAELKFKELNEANELLSNPEKRKKYDKYGENWKHADEIEKQENASSEFRSASGNRNTQQFSDEDLQDFYKSMFGGSGYAGGGRSSVKYKGQDLNAQLQLDIKDVFTTHKRTLTVNGKNIRLTIPAGVNNGQIIKIVGKGSPGINGGPNGDLFIEFDIINNTSFKRDAQNLYQIVDLDLYSALLGGEIMVNTFDGKVKLTVKPETQNNSQVRLKGKGFPVYKKENEYGDLFITYNIKMPTDLTKEEKELFTQLKKLR